MAEDNTTVGSLYPSDASKYKLIEQIGKGGNKNEVWKAECTLTDGKTETVAVKIINLEDMEEAHLNRVVKEIQIMNMCKHANLIAYHCSFVHKDQLWLVMRLLEGSCLDIMRFKYPNGLGNQEELVATILKQTLVGLVALHDEGLLHRDVKAGNILVDESGRICLADFGFSAILDSHDERRTTFVGTPCWMAPEVLDPEEYKGYDRRADTWSLGITAIELAYGRAPYAASLPMKVIAQVIKNPPPSLTNPDNTKDKKEERPKFSKSFQNFVSACLVKDPKKRATTQKLLGHKFITKASKLGDSFIKDELLKDLPPIGERFKEIYLPPSKGGKKRGGKKGGKKKGSDSNKEFWDFDALEEEIGKK
mmetsp:Transcript_18925/g.21092  ORF Transcript_18925/g.21092 Transcript_18925/m.21092 type:complete len:364 (+) Transcript_18925:31-1122(+)